MPGGSLSTIGNIAMLQVINVTLTPAASVGAGVSSTSTYTIPGLVVGDAILPCFQSAIIAPLSSDAMWVSAANTLSVQWTNASAATSSASPTAIATLLTVARCMSQSYGIAQYPNGIY